MSIKVEFGFAESGEPVTFNDISSDVISVNITRGKDPQQVTFNAGSCSVELKNESRNYDPDYGPSPYQGLIVPTGELKVFKDNQIMFSGYITDWNFSYSPSGESIAEIVASDAFWNLNNQTLAAFSPVAQLSSARILAVLLKPELGGAAIWPASSRIISTGIATLGDYEVTDGTNALTYLQEVEKAEPGRLFIDKQGRIVFRSRNDDIDNPVYTYIRQNLVNNPSFENNVLNWVIKSGTFTRSTSQAYIGSASGNLRGGAVVETYFTSEAAVTYTASVFVKASSGTPTVVLASITSDSPSGTYTEINSTSATVNSTDWTRIILTFEALGSFSGIKISQIPLTDAVFLDAILIEATPVVDAYFDGANIPVYNTSDPEAPDYQPQRVYESYATSWILL